MSFSIDNLSQLLVYTNYLGIADGLLSDQLVGLTTYSLENVNLSTTRSLFSSGIGATATAIRGTSGINLNKIIGITITNAGTGYQVAPVISFIGGGGSGAAATATIDIDINKSSDGFGENDAFKTAATGVLNFDENNPFGEIV
jgi:hypothetical protein